MVLDVREREAFEAGHIPTARHIPCAVSLSLRVNDELADPTLRIVVRCEFGKISTLATKTLLRDLGFTRAVVLDGGLEGVARGGAAVELS